MKKFIAVLLSLFMVALILPSFGGTGFTASADVANPYTGLFNIYNTNGTVSSNAEVLACSENDGQITIKVKLGADDYVQFAQPMTGADLLGAHGALQINLEDHEFGTAPGTEDTDLVNAYYNCDFRLELTDDFNYTHTGVDARWIISGPGAGYTNVGGSNPYIIASAGSRDGGANAWRFVARQNSLLNRGVALSLSFKRDSATNRIRLDATYSDKNTGADDDNLYSAGFQPADDDNLYIRLRSNKVQTYNIRLNTCFSYFKIYNTSGTLSNQAEVLGFSRKDGSISVKVRLAHGDYIQFSDAIPDLIDNPNVIGINLEDHEFDTVPTGDTTDLVNAYSNMAAYLQFTENSDYTAAWSHSAGTSWPLYGNSHLRISGSTAINVPVIQTNKNDGWGGANFWKYYSTVAKMIKRGVAIPLVFHTNGGNIYFESAIADDGSTLSDGTTTDSYSYTGAPLYVRLLDYENYSTYTGHSTVYNIRIKSSAYEYPKMVKIYNTTGTVTSDAEILSYAWEDGHINVKVRLGFRDYIQFTQPVTDLIGNPSALQINLEDHEFGTTHSKESNPDLYDAYHNCYFYVQATENPDLTVNYSNGGGSSWGASWPLCGNGHSRISSSSALSEDVVHSNKNDGWVGANYWAFFGKVANFVKRGVAMPFIFRTDTDGKVYIESPLEESSSGKSHFKDNFTPTGAPLYLRVMDYEGTGLSQVFNIRLYSKDLEYPSADYSAVNAAKARWESISYKGMLTANSRASVDKAIDRVVMGLRAEDQLRVDGYAADINSAINNIAVDSRAFKGASITITNSIRLNFYVPKALVDALDEGSSQVKFTTNTDKLFTVDDITPVLVKYDGVSFYRYSYDNIGPDRLSQDITASLSGTYNGGTAYASTDFVYSAKRYCMAELDLTDNAEERTLLVDLLNYGSESQTYVGFRTSDLSNKDLSATQRGYATQADPELNTDRRALSSGSYTAQWASVSLNLKDTVGIKYTLNPNGATVTSVRITDTYGKTLATVNAADFEDGKDGKKIILFNGLAVTEMSKVVKATAYNGDTQVSKSLSYSIDSYAYLKKNSTTKNLAALVKSMIKYGNAAAAYKASQSITTPVLYTTYNMEQDLTPITDGNTVYSESIMFFPDPMTGVVDDAPLLYQPEEVIAVRSSDLSKTYKEGVDYEVVNGCIRRLPGGSIPVIAYDTLYPSSEPDGWVAEHRRLDGRYCYITENYFPARQVVVTYTHNDTWQGPVTEYAGDTTLQITASKLKNNEDVKIIIYGDSISFGASASRTAKPYTPSFFNMFIQNLSDYYQSDNIEAVNVSQSGMGSEWAKKNAEERVAAEEADLCIIGWGMNGSTDATRVRYEQDIRDIISAARRGNPQAEIILISSHRANPDAVGYGENIKDYQVMLYKIAADTPNVAVLDMTAVHEYLMTRKRFLDMEANGVNHPNDFLARIHAQNLSAMLIPATENDFLYEDSLITNSKNVMIFGDSYSTFEGYIPEGNAVYYSKGHSYPTDVRNVEETWWYKVIDQTGDTLVRNDSWSGSTIGYTGYGGADNSHTSSFIYRLRRLKEQGFFETNKIDTIYVFGGTNDSWSDAPLGEAKSDGIVESDLYYVRPAIYEFFKELREICPDATIYGLVNVSIKDEIRNTLRDACAKYGAIPIDFDSIDVAGGHPTVKGMKEISDKVLQVVREGE